MADMDGYQTQVSLATHTTFQTGGPAQYFATATTMTELKRLLTVAKEAGQSVTILGGGSNVLVADAGIAGAVIQNRLTGWDVLEADDVVTVTIGAGEACDTAVARSVAAGWWGLENLSHIPGSVGAMPIQNVGAYGVETADCLQSVTALHSHTLEERSFSPAECQFAYRDSWFKTAAGREWIITEVTFTLQRTPQPQLSYRDLAERFAEQTPTLAEIREAVIDIRASKFPDWHEVGTAGSFFKNPIISREHFHTLLERYPELPHYPVNESQVKVPLGWILDNVCQLRGVQEGAVGSYAGQALVLVNYGDATTAEITAFAERIAASVAAATDISIEWEVTPLG